MPQSPPTTKVFFFLSGFLLAAVLPAFALVPHRPPKQAKQQVAALEEQWRAATLASDVPAMERMLSDDYVGVSWAGQVNNKGSQLNRLRDRTFAITRMDLSDMKIKIVQSVAIVTSRADIEGTNDGSPMVGQFRYTRVYQRLASGAWKITNFEATRMPGGGRHNRQSLSLENPPASP